MGAVSALSAVVFLLGEVGAVGPVEAEVVGVGFEVEPGGGGDRRLVAGWAVAADGGVGQCVPRGVVWRLFGVLVGVVVWDEGREGVAEFAEVEDSGEPVQRGDGGDGVAAFDAGQVPDVDLGEGRGLREGEAALDSCLAEGGDCLG